MPESISNLLSTATKELAPTSASATLDAEVLLCHCLNKNRSFLRAWPEHHPDSEQTSRFKALIEQRRQGRPIAYLTGEREFWSRCFMVTTDVLIPRADSELLIELSLAWLPADKPCKIIDLGTGSGILAITLAAERPRAQVTATDISDNALKQAIKNAQQIDTPHIRFIQSDWFNEVDLQHFDLVISNPPYIAENDPHLSLGDLRFEPIGALVSPDNGLKDIRVIAEQARRYLRPGGRLLIEHGYDQQAAAQSIFNHFNYRQVSTHTDLSGNPRVTSGLWNPT